jgi:hypothetical protein
MRFIFGVPPVAVITKEHDAKAVARGKPSFLHQLRVGALAFYLAMTFITSIATHV